MTFHGGTGALRAPLRVCWVPSSPSPPAHRTHLQPSLRSLPSSQRSFARGRAGRGQGRGIPGRALAAGTCSPPDGASRRRPPRPGLHLPGSNAGSRLATGPPHPPSGQLALKGTRPKWPPAGVAPSLAPPRFPHLAPPPLRSIPQPSHRAEEFHCPGPSGVMRSGVGGVGHHGGSSIPEVWDPPGGERRTRPDLAWPSLVQPGPSAPPRSGF